MQILNQLAITGLSAELTEKKTFFSLSPQYVTQLITCAGCNKTSWAKSDKIFARCQFFFANEILCRLFLR